MLKSIRDNLNKKLIEEEALILWQQLPYHQLEEAACSKVDRKMRAKKKLDDGIQDKMPENLKRLEEKVDKGKIKSIARKRQHVLLETVQAAYGVSYFNLRDLLPELRFAVSLNTV